MILPAPASGRLRRLRGQSRFYAARCVWRACRCAAVALVAIAAAPIEAADPAAPARPNIILIVADDLGYGDLGCFGQEKILTPHIDRLAREGMRFTVTYAGAPVCAPSRCVLLTGLHTGHARIRENSPEVGGELEAFGEGARRLSLTANDHTLTEALRSAGYATGAAGKWGLGEPASAGTPSRHGFDAWLGYLNQNHAAYYYTDFLWENERRRPIPENANGGRGVYSNDLFRDFALQFIAEHRHEPFFLYLPFTIPHERMEVPSLGDYANEDWPEEMRIYAAMVTRLDSYVGEIMDALDQSQLAANTLVIFTSDNGPIARERTRFFRSAGRLRGTKATMYEGGLRVPTIVRWPGRVPAGRVSDAPWGFVDVFPTLAALAGATVPANLDGRDVLAVWLGGSTDAAGRSFYWEFPRDRLWQAARHGRWKAVRFGTDQPLELYDLATDPGETHNVASEHPSVVADLTAFLDQAHTPSPHWPVN